jgi:predicted regulator of Ras-like GTPase activity (Roadblock/LC7/MglB family)
LSPAILALIFIAGGVGLVFLLLGSSIVSLFSGGITEQVVISMKEGNACIVEASDGIPRQITDCHYNVGDTISIVYKQQQPSILSHFSESKNKTTTNN